MRPIDADEVAAWADLLDIPCQAYGESLELFRGRILHTLKEAETARSDLAIGPVALGRHPYKVGFVSSSSDGTILKWVLAESSSAAKDQVEFAYSTPEKQAKALFSRKQKMSIGSFYKKYGKERTEAYFGRKV